MKEEQEQFTRLFVGGDLSGKDKLYLATISRALLRLARSSGDEDWMNDKLLNWGIDLTPEGISLIDEAESLATGLSIENLPLDVPREPMDCLLENICKENETHAYKYIPRPISLYKVDGMFPANSFDKATDVSQLWKSMKGDINQLCADNKRILAENLLNILYRYATTIPSHPDALDVSLYDQTRVATAIAVCLAETDGIIEKPFMLIGADFSGIQSYIYQIVSKYAARNLKGRSFYVHLLSDACVGYLLEQLGLFSANIIYDSGGCFYLLAPNTLTVKQSLDAAINYLEQRLFDAHGTSIYVAIDNIALSRQEVNGQDGAGLRASWQDLFTKRDRKKYCKFAEQMLNGSNMFEPQSINNDCRDLLTGEDDSDGSFIKDKQLGGFISPLNLQQIKMGQQLKSHDCIAVTTTEMTCWRDRVNIKPAGIGRYYYMLSQDDIRENEAEIVKHRENLSLRLLNGRNMTGDYGLTKIMGQCVTSMEFYGGNNFNGKTLEEMCEPEQDGAFSRMGILRMDVDNLGSIFQKGIAESRSNLARYAALSRCFDYFFSGYLNSIITNEAYADKCYVIYSGGDDLFIVGDWMAVIRIAHNISNDFKEYTCTNPAFSISGGLAIMNAKFPLIAGAKLSADEEKNSKSHKAGMCEKNSISFLNMPLNWEYEFPAVEELKSIIVSLLKDDKLPKSFISKVIGHWMSADIKEHKVRNYKIYWMMAYDMKRLSERCKQSETEAKRLILNCQQDICQMESTLNGKKSATDYHALELWAFACRWAELEYRSTKKEAKTSSDSE